MNSDPHRLVLNLTDKIILKRDGKYIALSNLSIHYIRTHIKTTTLNINSNIE